MLEDDLFAVLPHPAHKPRGLKLKAAPALFSAARVLNRQAAPKQAEPEAHEERDDSPKAKRWTLAHAKAAAAKLLDIDVVAIESLEQCQKQVCADLISVYVWKDGALQVHLSRLHHSVR